MSTSITIRADVDSVVNAAFSHDDSGRLLFGFAGYTVDPVPVASAAHAPVVIRDYLMERGVQFNVRLVTIGSDTSLVISDVAPDRLDSVVWFARKHLVAVGLVLAESSGDSTGG